MDVVIVSVEGMMCQKNCGTTVTNALKSVPGFNRGNASFALGAAFVEGCRLNPENVVEAVEMVGFDACIIKRDDPRYQPLEDKLVAGLAVVTVLNVQGMMCQKNCGTTVYNSLNRVPGVDNVIVSFPESCAVITGAARPLVLIDAVEMVGFDAQAVNDEMKKNRLIELLNNTKDQVDLQRHMSLSFDDQKIDSNAPEADEKEVVIEVGQRRRAEIQIGGMTCTACVANVEKNISKVSGIHSITVALISEKATIEYDSSILDGSKIAESVEQLGYKASVLDENLECNVSTRGVGVLEILLNKSTCVENLIDSLLAQKGVLVVERRGGPCCLKIKFKHEFVGARTLVSLIESYGFQWTFDTRKAQHVEDPAKYYRRMFLGSLLFTVPILLILYVCPLLPAIYSFLQSDVGDLNMKWHGMLLWALSTPVQFVFGARFYRNALNAVAHGSANMDVLVVLGTSSAYLYSMISMLSDIYRGQQTEVASRDSSFFETSAMLITFILLGKYLETSARSMTASAITALMDLQVDNAVLLDTAQGPEEEAIEREIDLRLVEVGDILKVFPGHRIPVDGVVVTGTSYVDESMLTGESASVSKSVGDSTTGSTVNGHGVLTIQATRVGSDTALAQIVKLVEDAQSSKAPIQDFADRIAKYFVPVVVFIAIFTWIIWFSLAYVLEVSFLDSIPDSERFVFSFKFGVAVLVISCPCALGLATPTAVMVSTGVGAKYGILIKGGESLEAASRITSVVMDKTGTITEGKATVADCSLFGTLTKKELFSLAGSAELSSEHVVAKAIVQYAKYLKCTLTTDHAEFEAKPGFGIDCTLVGGSRVIVGNRKMMKLNNVSVSNPAIDAFLEEHEKNGTVVLCASDESSISGMVIVGAIAISDPVKENAAYVVSLLKSLGISVYMCSGDNATTANAVAVQCGISPENVFANCLPNQKVNRIKKLQSLGEKVAMIGDGINDSPALTCADVGIAVGAGTDIAIQCADAVLIRNNLMDVAVFLHLSQCTIKRIKLNFFFSFVYNTFCIPLAAGLFYPGFHLTLPPMLAGFMMAMSSVSVVCSSLLLRRYKPPVSHRIDFVSDPLEIDTDLDTSFDDQIEMQNASLWKRISSRGYQILTRTTGTAGISPSPDEGENFLV